MLASSRALFESRPAVPDSSASSIFKEMKAQFLSSVIAAHGRELQRFLMSQVPEPSDAQDLLQEVYLRVLKLEQPEQIRCPRAYVYRIASNIVYEHRMKLYARPVHIGLDDILDEADQDLPVGYCVSRRSTPEDATLMIQRMARLGHLLGELSPKVRAAVIWAHRDGLTYKEISARLSVSSNRVKKYLTKALAHCRKHVADFDNASFSTCTSRAG